jgi:hypothetical protein
MSARPEQGSALAEAMISLALTGLILSAVLPAVLQARRMGTAAGRRAQLGDSGRLAGWRLGEDLRRAGFGLAGLLPAISLQNGGQEILIRYLEGGFAGGRPLTSPALAGDDLVQVTTTEGVKPGDACVLQDRRGGVHLLEIAAVDGGARTLRAMGPLPRSFHAAEGAQVQRVVQRRWWLEGTNLRRDDQIAVEPVTGLSLSSWAKAEAAQAVTWAVDSGPVDLPPVAAGLLAVRLRLSERPTTEISGPAPAMPGLNTGWLMRAVNVDDAMSAGSSMP